VGEPLAVPLLEPARGDDDPVDPPIDEEVQIGLFAARIVGAVAQQDGKVPLERRVLHRPDDLRVVGVLDVGHEQAEGARCPELERPGNLRRAVAERLYRGQDPRSGLRLGGDCARDNSAHGCRRNPCLPGDVADCRLH